MKLRSSTNRTEDQGGYALAIVLIFCTLGLFVMASVLALSSNDSALTQRNNEYFSTLSAAEAATEKGLSQMTSDFMDQGAATVDGNLSAYRGAVPTAAESSRWNQFVFKNTSGVTNALGVQLVSDWAANSLLSQYRGLSGYAATYEITSIAQDLQGRQVSAGVQQDVQLATVPTCQFAIFYNLDMEINPSGLMGISGPVHCNGNIYLDPPGQLVFTNDVTSSQNIYTNKSPNDPKTRKSGTVAFQGARDSGTGTFDIPIGTNSSPSAVDAILQI
ncbi:MAG: hypothetical protein KGR98_04175, partial [Verrucomicrobia bacterium]|nr:hypothetical protein [Verrucomicrobiota bacterium]